MDVSRLNTDFAPFGVNDTRTVRANESRLRLVLKRIGDLECTHKPTTRSKNDRQPYPDFVSLGDTLSNANDQRNFIVDGFNNRVGSRRWRDIDHSRVRLSLLDSLHEGKPHATGVDSSIPTKGSARGSSLTSFTDPKTGKPRCVVPAFLGETPPTMFVPYANASLM